MACTSKMTRKPLMFYPIFIVLLGWAASSGAQARQIICAAETSDQELSVTVQPSGDVFAMQHMDFENGHRVSVQWLQNPDRLKTYVYNDLKNRLVLLNSQVYPLNPAAACGQRAVDARSYSGEFERELVLQCEWTCGNEVQK